MKTDTESNNAKPLDRRWFLKLAVASMLVVTACTNTRHGSDLDAAMSELEQLIDDMDPDDQQRVTTIAQRIRASARELADEHRTFTGNFDHLLSTYDTTEAKLEQLIVDYGKRRTQMRDDLLRLQDQLHTAMAPEDWAEVVRVLNRAGKSLAGYQMRGL